MLVVQIFVTKDGAFQGVEMACGPRIVVGPQDADVPLVGVTDAGVVLSLDGETLVAAPIGAARVDGAPRPTRVSPSSDVAIGGYTLKLRRMKSQTDEPARKAREPAPVALATTRLHALAVTQPELVTLAEPDVTAPALEARAQARREHDEDPGLVFAPTDVEPDPLDDVIDDDFSWSLVEQLALAPDATGDHVEVIEAFGEHVLAHVLLDDTRAFLRNGRALVRRTHDGACDLVLPPRAHAVVRRRGESTEMTAGEKPLTVRLARGDGAALRVDDHDVLVRFASRPAFAMSADQLATQRLERKVQAVCASAGVSLCSMFGMAAWIAEYRGREIDIELPDDVSAWPEVEIEIVHPKPVPEPEPVVSEPVQSAPQPEAQQRSEQKPAPAAKAKGGDAKQESGAPGDFLKNLPALKSNRSLEDAVKNMRAPLPGRPTGPILKGLVGRGRRDDAPGFGGSGLRTGVSPNARDDAGALEQREGREIGATVNRARLNKLKTAGEQGLSKEEILRVINEHIGEIQYCYEKGLRGDASLGGRAVAAWTIAPDGHVTVAGMETSTLEGNAVENCMLARIKEWRFPRKATGSAVVYPFQFSSL